MRRKINNLAAGAALTAVTFAGVVSSPEIAEAAVSSVSVNDVCLDGPDTHSYSRGETYNFSDFEPGSVSFRENKRNFSIAVGGLVLGVAKQDADDNGYMSNILAEITGVSGSKILTPMQTNETELWKYTEFDDQMESWDKIRINRSTHRASNEAGKIMGKVIVCFHGVNKEGVPGNSNSGGNQGGGETRFEDVPEGHLFIEPIEAIAKAGITKGCNPPKNTKFCPDDSVLRGQMTAFISRWRNLPPATKDYFIDDNGHLFEDDINRVAEAGIITGCNPPKNDKICPNEPVGRDQKAKFLTRTLKLPPATKDHFIDDNGSIFEDDINRLAEAGITKGCNPPKNDRYCPRDAVKRGQMSAFMHRSGTI